MCAQKKIQSQAFIIKLLNYRPARMIKINQPSEDMKYKNGVLSYILIYI
jgi:hypothetical protein